MVKQIKGKKKKRIRKDVRKMIKLERLSRGWWDPKVDTADFYDIMKKMNEHEKWKFKKRILTLIKNAKKPNAAIITE